MYDLTQVLDTHAGEPAWAVPPRDADVRALVHAAEETQLNYVVGPHGVGKTRHIQAAISVLTGQGRFGHVLPTTSRLASQDLERALRKASATNRLLVGVDKPKLLRPTDLSLLVAKVRDGSCVVFVECADHDRLAEPLRRLGQDIGAHTHALERLSEEEVGDHLTTALGAPVVSESVHLLWYRTGGNQELLSLWVPELRASGELYPGHYAWYWQGWSQPAPSVVQYIRERYQELNWTQQQVIEHLTIAGSVAHADLVRVVHEEDLAHLEGCGLIKHLEGSGLPLTVRLAAPVWGDVIRDLIPPARRWEIFAQTARPVANQRDQIAALSWALAALENGYEVSDSELLVATRAAFMLRCWHFIEAFVGLRLPRAMSAPELVAEIAQLDQVSRVARISMLVERAMGYQRQSRFGEALCDLTLVRNLVALDPENLAGFLEAVLLVESSILRALPDGGHTLGERFHAEATHAAVSADHQAAYATHVRSLLFPTRGVNLSDQLAELGKLLDCGDPYSAVTLSVLPQTIYLLGLSGRLSRAKQLCEHGLEASSRNTSQPTHPWLTTDVVSAWFTVSLWSGSLTPERGIKDLEKMARIFDSAALQTGLGRILASGGQWEGAWRQYSGALERYAITDPFGQRKLALAGYAQALAALGHYEQAAVAIYEYDQTPHLGTVVVASDLDYLVLTASYALGLPDFSQRLEAFLQAAQQDEHWFSCVRGAHLGVIATSGEVQRDYMRVLEQAASCVDKDVSGPYILDAWALISGAPAEVVRTRSALARRGVWVPGLPV